MPLTLAQAKVGMADKVVQTTIDEFRRSNFLLENLTFDNAVSPGTGGSTMSYGYIMLKTPSVASARALNTEYTPGEALREKKTADIKIMGGAYQVDRVLEKTAAASEIAFQSRQKVIATSNKFNYEVINGDSSIDTNGFDGLDKLLTGSDTEYNLAEYELTKDTALVAGKTYFTKSGDTYTPVASPVVGSIATYYEIVNLVDLSTSDLMDDNYNAFLDKLDEFISLLDGKPTMLLMNNKMVTKLRSIARRAGYYTQSEDAFGNQVENYNGIPFVDLEEYFNGTKSVPCVPIDGTLGTTDIYAVVMGLDGFHGISPTGNKVIEAYLPNMKAPGAVKTGEVELLAGVVLKASRKAGVFRNIKVK